LAVIGPLSDDRKAPLGTWAPIGRAEDVVTVLEGLRSRVSPDTKITHVPGCGVSDPSTTGFAEAVRIASESDVAVLVIGEDAEMSGEAHCRSTIDLPGVQRQLVEAIQATGTPVVAVVLAGRPLSITWTAEHVPAILFAWHLGVESGNAIADVLFGDHNPSARLPMTFPRTVGQIPLYYNHKPTGRPPTDQRYTSKYIDVPWTPLYPFGYGLSYTTFRYDKLTVSAGQIGVAGTVTVSVEVTNVGQRDGHEVVQLYVRDVVGSMTRPVRQLKAFKRITLQPGQTETVVFSLAAGELGFYDYRVQYTVEPGEFEVWVGPNSAEGQRGRFELVSD
ncbi:MAG: hypothetical protein GY778_01960, partial [bacterium]|nr:hypothetical protein [bacterium]